ncbi:STAS domain-containing protein [Halanaerobacter jeridensis]|uniref:Anti-sigma factor antagonist n=1 Tax=Halanaerobacter jeridensis TaxID=706427 RepID=A0A939BPE6_9FIRM|nr:STAS domain-containing protein [Halanaerobacter jeridensis]MBM7556733.1 anti-anti-sigma factor [Halanaerobacter jeridensis]
MKIEVEKKDNIKIIRLIGDLDGTSAPEVREEIISHINDNSKLVFDMSQCEYISSAGLRVLLIIAKKLKAKGGQGVLAGLVEEVKDVMEITGFDHMLTSYESIDTAINSL